ncbi:hypothetical protein Tamer19_43460 [Cupriavidus sp. TA19]|nr:hypothetical protein Tamer19_43460 [Cupriavidus sp. TA19]
MCKARPDAAIRLRPGRPAILSLTESNMSHRPPPLPIPQGGGLPELSHALRTEYERNAGIVKTYHIQP